MSMNVKEAVARAKSEISDLFSEESIRHLGLEEVLYDEDKGVWRITLGFSRPWDEPQTALSAIAGQSNQWRRDYKVITIKDDTEDVVSILAMDEGR